jgi:hypothetical protein
VRHSQLKSSGDISKYTHHLVEAGRVLEAVPNLEEGALFLLVLAAYQVHLHGEVLDVGPEMLQSFQSVREITAIKKRRRR